MVMTMTLMTHIDDDSDDDTDDEDGEHDDEDHDDDAEAVRWPQGRSNRCQDRRSAGFLAANFQETFISR